jgi:hypothetical protein
VLLRAAGCLEVAGVGCRVRGTIFGMLAYGWVGLVRSTTFQQFLQQSQARLAMQRLGLLLAAVASLSGAQACQTFAMQCLTMVSSGVGKQVHVSANGMVAQLSISVVGSSCWLGILDGKHVLVGCGVAMVNKVRMSNPPFAIVPYMFCKVPASLNGGVRRYRPC